MLSRPGCCLVSPPVGPPCMSVHRQWATARGGDSPCPQHTASPTAPRGKVAASRAGAGTGQRGCNSGTAGGEAAVGRLHGKDRQQVLSPDSPQGVKARANPRAPGDGGTRLCQGRASGPSLRIPWVTWGCCLLCHSTDAVPRPTHGIWEGNPQSHSPTQAHAPPFTKGTPAATLHPPSPSGTPPAFLCTRSPGSSQPRTPPAAAQSRAGRGGGAPPQPPRCPRRAVPAKHPPPWPWRGGRRAGLCRAVPGGAGRSGAVSGAVRSRAGPGAVRGAAEPRGGGGPGRPCAQPPGPSGPPRGTGDGHRAWAPGMGTGDGLLPPPSLWQRGPGAAGGGTGCPGAVPGLRGTAPTVRPGGLARRVPELGYLWDAAQGAWGKPGCRGGAAGGPERP